MARIDVIQPDEAGGRLKEIYDNIRGSRGKIAEIHKIQSLHPETIEQHMSLYMGIMFSRSPLSRAQREMMAVVVSAANGCAYCQEHHLEALLHFWKDETRGRALIQDYTQLALDPTDRALCDYAWDVTVKPDQAASTDPTERLRQVDMEDRAVLDATLVVGYFNFVNRLVLALDVDVENDPGGYTYE